MSDSMHYDVAIVGGGPSALCAAIRLKQLSKASNKDLSVCILEKGSEIGAHILSGAILEPRALDELIPQWRSEENPLKVQVQDDEFFFLTKSGRWPIPTPPQMNNQGNYSVRLGFVCQWLAQKAQALGVEIYPGFPVAKCLFNDQGAVCGVETQPMGISKDGKHTSRFQPGIRIMAQFTLLGEGCRGSVTKSIVKAYNLDKNCDPQTYGLGIKEIWEVKSPLYYPGAVTHTVGWPLKSNTYGGSFIYHLAQNLVSIGFVVGLDYENPYLSPFEEFQKFKTHLIAKSLLEGGKRISYGARALNEGGFQSIPKLTFPGGCLIGCSAGFLNVPKLKGTHTAMKSGMVAAESVFEALNKGVQETNYQQNMEQSWVWEELYKARNIRPVFKKGLWTGMAYAALDTYVLRGKAKWTFRHTAPDHQSLKPANESHKIIYSKPSGLLTFDKLSSVYLSNTNHEENQPCHLRIIDATLPEKVNLNEYAGLESRYCPAGVYEYQKQQGQYQLQINFQNCIHCKACDIKDPLQNITWVPPEGGGGPNYSGM